MQNNYQIFRLSSYKFLIGSTNPIKVLHIEKRKDANAPKPDTERRKCTF